MTEKTLVDPLGRKIPTVAWTVKSPKARIMLVHGFAEHYRPYADFAAKMNEAGFSVYAFDLPGHGLAEGRRCHIDSFQEYIDNLDWYIGTLKGEKPLYLMGHSMGGLISAHYATGSHPKLKGLILSSPLTGFDGVGMQVMKLVGKILAAKMPQKTLPKLFNPKELTSDPSKWEGYASDPLRGQSITPSMFNAMNVWAGLLHKNAKLVKMPLLVFYSKADKVVSPSEIERFFAAAASNDKELVAFSESGHEIVQDPAGPEMINKIVKWLENHLAK